MQSPLRRNAPLPVIDVYDFDPWIERATFLTLVSIYYISQKYLRKIKLAWRGPITTKNLVRLPKQSYIVLKEIPRNHFVIQKSRTLWGRVERPTLVYSRYNQRVTTHSVRYCKVRRLFALRRFLAPVAESNSNSSSLMKSSRSSSSKSIHSFSSSSFIDFSELKESPSSIPSCPATYEE